MFKKRNSLLLHSLPLMLVMPGVIHAGALEEVIVTAQKTEESVQSVPIAISAFTSKGLEDAGIRSSDELSVVTPGLQYGRQVANATPFIRGVGTSNTSNGDESSVATYVDGVYYADFTAAIQSFNNLERIEVLKGPQGTLFGRNASGGMIHYITKDPTQAASAKLKFSYGNYGTSGINFYGTTGLTETLAADLAVFREEQADGFGKNLATGHEANKATTTAARSKWLFTPSDATSVTLAMDYAESKSSIAMSLAVAPGATGFAGQQYTGDWWDINSNLDPEATNHNWGVAATVDHNFSDLNLVSITAYRKSNQLQVIDQDGTALAVVDAPLNSHTNTFSQEFRLSSDSDDSLRWMVGLFYYDAKAAFDPFDASGLAFQANTAGAATSEIQYVEQDTQSYAAFGQATYSFSDALNLTLGLRYTKDDRSIDGTGGLFSGPNGTGVEVIPLPHTTNDKSWEKLTWRIALDYKLNESTLLYASYSRGFKSGVFNSIAPADQPVNPETLDAYEVGLKADLFDNTLRWNTALFYYKYDDLQIQRLNGGFTQLINAAKVISYGLDSSLDYAITDNLTLSTGLALLHARFDDFPGAPFLKPNPGFPFGNIPSGSDALGNENVKGNDVIRSPRWTGSVGLIYGIDTAQGGFDASVYYYHNDGFFWEPDNRFKQDAYSTVNASVSWALPGKNWVFGLYGRNLTNEKYSYFSTGGQLGDVYSAAPPRTYGVSVEYKLGG